MKRVTYTDHRGYGLPWVALKRAAEGRVVAVVAVFGNVDLQGDRIASTAFDRWLREFRAKNGVLPIVFSHEWSSAAAHVGKALAEDVSVTREGLEVSMQFDMDTESGRHVFEMIREKRITQWSFAYEIRDERKVADGARELLDLEVIEAGPCLLGANPMTRTVSVKALSEMSPPWTIEQRNGHYCIVKDGTGALLTRHDSLDQAIAQLRSVLAAEEAEMRPAEAPVGAISGKSLRPVSPEVVRMKRLIADVLAPTPTTESNDDFKRRMLREHGDSDLTRQTLGAPTRAELAAQEQERRLKAMAPSLNVVDGRMPLVLDRRMRPPREAAPRPVGTPETFTAPLWALAELG